GSEDEQEEGDGAPDPGYVEVPAGEGVVSHAAEQEQELHTQCLRQHGAGGEDEKDTRDGGRQEQDCRANHEALMGFRAVAQKIGSGNQSNKRKQPKKLEGQESQWRGPPGGVKPARAALTDMIQPRTNMATTKAMLA